MHYTNFNNVFQLWPTLHKTNLRNPQSLNSKPTSWQTSPNRLEPQVFFCCSIKPSHQFWTCFDVGGVNSENFPESTYDFLPLFPCGVSKVLFLFWETPVYARTHTHTRTRFHFITASRRNHFFSITWYIIHPAGVWSPVPWWCHGGFNLGYWKKYYTYVCV